MMGFQETSPPRWITLDLKLVTHHQFVLLAIQQIKKMWKDLYFYFYVSSFFL